MLDLSFGEIVAITLFFCITSYSLTPLMIRIAKRYEIVDKPNQAHKTHTQSVPYLGGFAIIIPLSLAFLLSPFYFQEHAIPYNEYLVFIIAPIVLSIVGAIDDKKQLAAIPRLILQVSASTLILAIFVSKDWYGNAFSSPTLNFTISLIWIVGITNSINFFDNLDGGAAGFTVVASFAIFLLASLGGQSAVALMAIALSGSSLGFLYWNRNPARIYLGDAGALFVGMMLAILLIRLDPVSPNEIAAFLTPVLVMAIPIIDTSVAVLSRIKRRVSPFLGGRDHLSHRLQRRGFTRRQSAIILWVLSGYFCFLSLLLQLLSRIYSVSLIIFSVSSGIILFLWFLFQSDGD